MGEDRRRAGRCTPAGQQPGVVGRRPEAVLAPREAVPPVGPQAELEVVRQAVRQAELEEVRQAEPRAEAARPGVPEAVVLRRELGLRPVRVVSDRSLV
jgi:hypothetical protein